MKEFKRPILEMSFKAPLNFKSEKRTFRRILGSAHQVLIKAASVVKTALTI
jgi:hypothetical protein